MITFPYHRAATAWSKSQLEVTRHHEVDSVLPCVHIALWKVYRFIKPFNPVASIQCSGKLLHLFLQVLSFTKRVWRSSPTTRATLSSMLSWRPPLTEAELTSRWEDPQLPGAHLRYFLLLHSFHCHNIVVYPPGPKWYGGRRQYLFEEGHYHNQLCSPRSLKHHRLLRARHLQAGENLHRFPICQHNHLSKGSLQYSNGILLYSRSKITYITDSKRYTRYHKICQSPKQVCRNEQQGRILVYTYRGVTS